MINPERLCQDFMQMWQSKGRLALRCLITAVLNLWNAPSAQAPESPRVALSEPCSWRVQRAPSRVVLICHESEAGPPKGSHMPGRWSPQTAAPALISQLEAKTTSTWKRQGITCKQESIVFSSIIRLESCHKLEFRSTELDLTVRL